MSHKETISQCMTVILQGKSMTWSIILFCICLFELSTLFYIFCPVLKLNFLAYLPFQLAVNLLRYRSMNYLLGKRTECTALYLFGLGLLFPFLSILHILFPRHATGSKLWKMNVLKTLAGILQHFIKYRTYSRMNVLFSRGNNEAACSVC